MDAYDGHGDAVRVGREGPDPARPGRRSSRRPLKPISDMSADLIAHVRYPADLFKVQRSILQTYHVTDASSFYSGDDAWATPNDPTPADGHREGPAAVLPDDEGAGHEGPAFSLYSTYIPKSSIVVESQSVLTGYLAVNSDAGPRLRQADPARRCRSKTRSRARARCRTTSTPTRRSRRAEPAASRVRPRSSRATC